MMSFLQNIMEKQMLKRSVYQDVGLWWSDLSPYPGSMHITHDKDKIILSKICNYVNIPAKYKYLKWKHTTIWSNYS
jgi:hypothetical protein